MTLAPVVEDLSAWILPGRVTPSTAKAGLEDAREAERLGFSRVFLAERYNLKEAGTVLGGIGAVTSRIGLGTGVIAVRSRHPLMTAALGASLHAHYGPRFVLGVGRSASGAFGNADQATYTELLDHLRICKSLWNNEVVTYNGPAGSFDGLRLHDVYDGPAPQIWIGIAGLPMGAAAAADPVVDGVVLLPMMTPAAARTAVANLRGACEAADRDPASLRICQPVVTAPDLPDEEIRELAHARLVTYLQWPSVGELMVKLNDWDPAVVQRIRDHRQFATMAGKSADESFHRSGLTRVAELIPDEWIDDSAGVGPLADCVSKVQEFRDAGVDEVAIYGSTPRQNASLIEAWRAQSATAARPQ